MREIKFRGKRPNGEWIQGYYCQWQNHHYIAPDPHECGFTGGEVLMIDIAGFVKVIPETVGQFAGLHDKKRTKEFPEGQEIYEGDILRKPAKDEWEKTNYSAFEVFFHDNDCAWGHIGFQMNRMHNFGAVAGGFCPPFLPKTTANFEVVGNIHESPELIEEKK